MADTRIKGPLGRSAEDTGFEVEVVQRKPAINRGSAGNLKTSNKKEIKQAANNSNTASNEDIAKPTEKPTVPPKPTRPKKPSKETPTLKQGHRGKDVEKLQRILNARLVNYEDLDVDGIFGPKTEKAVKDYQLSVGISSDGIVGKQTWYHLLKGDESNAGNQGAAATQTHLTRASTINVAAGKVHQKASPRRQLEEAVWEWPLDKKILAVLERVPDRLPGKAKEEFKQLLQLENIALSLVIIAGFCLLSGGTALILGMFILGFDVCMSLGSALLITSWAATKDELNEAADEISHLIITVGVGAFFKGVGKIAKRIKGRSKTGKGSGDGADGGGGKSKGGGEPPKKPKDEPSGNSSKDKKSTIAGKDGKIGHTTPWDKMTKAEKRAFQHSYSRHAKELGLPNWSQKNAEALRQQFNNRVGQIRNNGTKVKNPPKKPFNGKSVEVNMFEQTVGGKKYYYYETLDGKFISAGESR